VADGVCIGCGVETKVFASSGKRAKWCSRPCRIRNKERSPKTQEQRSRYNERKRAIRLVVSGTCLRCGNGFSRTTCRGGVRYGKYCSQACNVRHRMETGGNVGCQFKPLPEEEVQARAEANATRARLVTPEVKALRRIANWRPGLMRTVRPCRDCRVKTAGVGERKRRCLGCRSLKAEKGRAKAKSLKRIYKSRRRAIERGAHADRIDPIKVFDRDKWLCHLCGTKTPKHLRGSYDDKAPELDHVVPLACGGTHTWGNVKCSCRKCNRIKADKPLGQLAMDWAA
jgi:5-methylcytosine-specific restriction endonuclease McrA